MGVGQGEEGVDSPTGPGPGLHDVHYSEYDLEREMEDQQYYQSKVRPTNITPAPVQMITPVPGFAPAPVPPPQPVQMVDNYQQEQSSSFTQTFLRGILTSLDSRDPVVANAWLETLLDAIDLLPIEVIKQEIIGIAINKSQLSQPAFSRMAACKILGKLSTKLDQLSVRQEVLPPTLSLCQDVESDVRNCMCRHLAFIARGVGLDLTKSAILPVLVELSNDESSDVRLSAIETVVHLLSLLDDEICNNTIVPLVIKSCEQAKSLDDCTLPVIARHLGRLCHGLTPNLSEEQKDWFINYYRELSRLGCPSDEAGSGGGSSTPMPDLVPRAAEDKSERYVECRQACAYNLPGMVLFVGAANFTDQLLGTFCDLAVDPSPYVRKTIASGLHELIKIIGSKFSLTKQQIVSLFNDNSVDVLSSMVANMVYVIDALARFGVLQFGSTGSYSQELSVAILHMEEVINATRNWRLHADCLEKISCLANCISATVIHSRYIPLLFTRACKSRPLPCRNAAVRTLLVILRFTVKQEYRSSILSRMKEELANGRSCHSRLLYLKMCEMAIMLFSRSYFKQHFFHQFLALHQDRVPNVRLCVVNLLPQLKALISLPSDNSLLQYLEEVVKNLLLVETDRDVLNSLQAAINSLADIETGVDGILNPHFHTEEDRDDDRKLREEKLIANMEEQIKQVQGTKFDQLVTPSAIPSRLRSLGIDRKRSESLPPPLTRGESQATKARFNSPEPPKYTEVQKMDAKHFSPELSRRPIWTSPSSEAKKEEEFKPRSSLSTPYSSSLENLDPNTQEFLVDAGIKLPNTTIGSMSSAASMPNLTSIGVVKEPLVRSNSIPDNHNLDGELSKYLISNKEMEIYEAEYHKAAKELKADSLDAKPTTTVEPVVSSPKLRGRSDTRLRPPSFTSALTARPTKPGGDAPPLPSQHTKPESKLAQTGAGSRTKPSRISPPKEDRGGNHKWNDGSIERLAEKWAAKRDTLLKETGVTPDNWQQRKVAMEQKLESVKRSIPKRSSGLPQDLATKRLSLCDASKDKSGGEGAKRKSLDVDIVLLPESTDSEEDDPKLSRKLGEIRKSNEAKKAKELFAPKSPALNRKSSPELGSSDSDDSLPPYPTIDKTRIEMDQPLPPPPPSLDSLFNIPDLETPTIISSASKLAPSRSSSLPSYRMVTAPQTSVAVSRSVPAPQRSIANSPQVPPVKAVRKPEEGNLSYPPPISSKSEAVSHQPASVTSAKSSLGANPSLSFAGSFANSARRISKSQEDTERKGSSGKLQPPTSEETRRQEPSSLYNSKLVHSNKPASGLFQGSMMQGNVHAINVRPGQSKRADGGGKPVPVREEKPTPSEKASKTVVYIKADQQRSRELKPPQTLQTKPLNRSHSPQSLQKPRPLQTATVRRGKYGGKTLSAESILDQNDNEAPGNNFNKSALRENSTNGKISRISYSQGMERNNRTNYNHSMSNDPVSIRLGYSGSSDGSSRSSSPPGDSQLTPDSLESFSPAVTPQSPGSASKPGRGGTGIVGPRRSSGMRMWQGQLGSRRSSVSPNTSRSPSPSSSKPAVSQQQQGPARKTETLPRTSNISRMRAPGGNHQPQTQRRSYGGLVSAGQPSPAGGKYASAPNTPRHSRNDLRQAGSSPSSPGVSRSTSPSVNMNDISRRRSAHYPSSSSNTSSQAYDMKSVPARTVSERSLFKPTTDTSSLQTRTLAHSAEISQTKFPSSSYSSLSSLPQSRGYTSNLSNKMSSSPHVRSKLQEPEKVVARPSATSQGSRAAPNSRLRLPSSSKGFGFVNR